MTDQERARARRLYESGCVPKVLNGVPCICTMCTLVRQYLAEQPKPVPPEAYRGTRSGALKL